MSKFDYQRVYFYYTDLKDQNWQSSQIRPQIVITTWVMTREKKSCI